MRIIPVSTEGRDACAALALENPNVPYSDKVWAQRDIEHARNHIHLRLYATSEWPWPITHAEPNVIPIRKGKRP